MGQGRATGPAPDPGASSGCGRPTLTRAPGWLIQWRPDMLADLLHGPVVAVGIGEVEELAAIAGIERLDASDLQALPGQLGAGRLDVGDDELQPGPHRAQVSVGGDLDGADHHRAR